MVNKFKLSFFIDSDLETPEKEAEAVRWFDRYRRTAFENFTSALKNTSDVPEWLSKAKGYLETPERLYFLDEMSAKKVLAELAQNKIFRLLGAIDEALFELTKEGVKPEAAFVLPTRFERLRAEFEIWREAIRNGNFEVYQTRPYEKMPEYFQTLPGLKNQYTPAMNGMFPDRRFTVPWKPEIDYKTPAQGKRLIWNGAKNALAYIFYQLKYEHATEERKPILDASNEDLAEFLKASFECFKDDKITTIMALFENKEKHPQKANNRFIITKGTPPKD